MSRGRTTHHKEGRATVRIVYFTSKTLADGSHPLLVRITKDRKRQHISTGLSLLPKYWNPEKSNYREAVRKSYPEPGREKLLTKLAEWEGKYQQAAEALADNDEQHGVKAISAKATESRHARRRTRLLAYCYELAEDYAKTGQTGNATVYRDLGNQLAKFIAAQSHAPAPPSGRGKRPELAAWVDEYDLPLERVDAAFCRRWEQALRASGVRETTLSNRFRTLRAVLNQAIAAGLLKADAYPFARTVTERHKFTVGKFDVSTSKRAVTREEVRQFAETVPASEREQLAQDVFLFSFYCGGINWVDLAQLRWRDIAGSEAVGLRLSYERQKTGGKFNLKLVEPAAAIISKYRPITRTGPDGYLFPVLDPARHKTAAQVKNRLHKVLGQVNQDLKALGERAGIATPLTTYVARHSFATALHRGGTSTAVIGQVMGHKSAAVTAVYLDSLSSSAVDAALDDLV